MAIAITPFTDIEHDAFVGYKTFPADGDNGEFPELSVEAVTDTGVEIPTCAVLNLPCLANLAMKFSLWLAMS